MSDTKFFMQDVYDYLMENDFSIGTNFLTEFPESWADDEKNIIYLAKEPGKAAYKITMEKV